MIQATLAFNTTYTSFADLKHGDRVSGTYNGINFAGVVVYTWIDNIDTLAGTKIAHVRLIPGCVGEGLPIQQINGLPERIGRKIALYHSDLWSNASIAPSLVFDKEYQPRH